MEILIQPFSSKDIEGQTSTSPPDSHKTMSMWGAGCQLEVHGSVSSLASASDGEGKGLLNFTPSEYSHHGLYSAGTGFTIAKRLQHGEELYFSKILMQHKMLVIEQKSSSNKMSISS